MKSFILVPLCVFISQFPLLYLLILNYSIGVTDSLSYFLMSLHPCRWQPPKNSCAAKYQSIKWNPSLLKLAHWQLRIFFHVIWIGSHDEVLWVYKVMCVCMYFPAGIITFMCNVTFSNASFKLSKVKPSLIVLEKNEVTMIHTRNKILSTFFFFCLEP